MKNYFIFAAALLALASCSSDDIIGGGQTSENANETAISFGGNSGKITRATSNTGSVANMLDHQFMIYGVKAAADNKYADVFKNYILWDATAHSTTTNTNGWEYVGNADQKYGTDDPQSALGNAQTIKFWDYSSANYHFVAGSPVSAFKYKTSTTTGDIESATVTGLVGHITPNKVEEGGTWTAKSEPSPVYVAEPKNVAKDDYNKVVTFNFVRQQSKVRVGIYETIPGYKIKEIKFYKQGENGFANDAASNNVILTSTAKDYFVGASNATGTIKYEWSGETPTYSFTYEDGQEAQDGKESTKLTKDNNWYGGEFKSGVPATASNETNKSNLYGVDQDMESTGYFTVIPTPSATNASAILIKCDYTLESEDNSGEEIKVTGATAAIPAAFCKWETNTQYTYLFKISQNTNGTTGGPEHPGLFPITFDAVVAEVKDGDKQGTITTVATPSITTYQAGSVTDAGIEYKTGTAIYATVANEKGEEQELTADKVQVYKLSGERTEADLQVANINSYEIKEANKQTTTVLNADTTVDGVKLESGKYLSFTPKAIGYYAIQYTTTTSDSKTVNYYKVVRVNIPAK